MPKNLSKYPDKTYRPLLIQWDQTDTTCLCESWKYAMKLVSGESAEWSLSIRAAISYKVVKHSTNLYVFPTEAFGNCPANLVAIKFSSRRNMQAAPLIFFFLLTVSKDICCPIEMACFTASFTPSHIVCCANTSSHCDYPDSKPPECLAGRIQCSADAGGGCCPEGTSCSPNGCIQALAPSIITSSQGPTQSVANTGPVVTSPFSQPSQTMVESSPTIITQTLVEAPATTITVVKQGEVAQKGVAQRVTVFFNLYPPYMLIWALLCVTAIMGML
jgi:hypothetical protein